MSTENEEETQEEEISEEDLPLHDSLDVLEFETVNRNDGWWSIVATYRRYGSLRTSYYLFQANDDGGWSRRQKASSLAFRGKSDWPEASYVIENQLENHDEYRENQETE